MKKNVIYNYLYILVCILLIIIFFYYVYNNKESFNDIIETTTSNNLKIHCFKGDNIICKYLNETHTWEDLISQKLIEYYKPNTNFIDIGSGKGDIVRYVDSLGLSSEGIEIDNTLKKYNTDLNIHFKSAYNHDYSKYDIIYLYRPMESKDKMDKLFEKISSDIKKSSHVR